jgi:hypothetical protein
MEPTGIEPVTSCLQSARSGSNASAGSREFAGYSVAPPVGEISENARGLPALIVGSGTSGDECPDEPATSWVRCGRSARAVRAETLITSGLQLLELEAADMYGDYGSEIKET